MTALEQEFRRIIREEVGALLKINTEACRKLKPGVLPKHIDDLGLSIRARNVLYNAHIVDVNVLIYMTEAQLLAHKNFGRRSLRDVTERLAAYGLRLGNNWR